MGKPNGFDGAFHTLTKRSQSSGQIVRGGPYDEAPRHFQDRTRWSEWFNDFIQAETDWIFTSTDSGAQTTSFANGWTYENHSSGSAPTVNTAIGIVNDIPDGQLFVDMSIATSTTAGFEFQFDEGESAGEMFKPRSDGISILSTRFRNENSAGGPGFTGAASTGFFFGAMTAGSDVLRTTNVLPSGSRYVGILKKAQLQGVTHDRLYLVYNTDASTQVELDSGIDLPNDINNVTLSVRTEGRVVGEGKISIFMNGEKSFTADITTDWPVFGASHMAPTFSTLGRVTGNSFVFRMDYMQLLQSRAADS